MLFDVIFEIEVGLCGLRVVNSHCDHARIITEEAVPGDVELFEGAKGLADHALKRKCLCIGEMAGEPAAADGGCVIE